MLTIQHFKCCKSISLKLSNIFIIIVILLIISSNVFFSVENAMSTDVSIAPIYSLDINLDYNQTSGIIKHFSEINCGPLPNHDVKNGVDLTNEYQDIGISFIRTHDFSGPTDISTIFPDWDADPTLESSYDFTTSNQFITAIINAGCNVFYRLGESASPDKSLRNPPENMSKWAEVCKHIAMHYNDGWNNGYFYNITYWEIWNEPDIVGFWNGTAEDYYHLYHTTVETLKTYNPSLKVGGPCTSTITSTDYTTGFLSYLSDNNLPLDFFSWHQYADTPSQLFTSSKTVRNLLDTHGFTDCENINTEWNINILTPQRDKDNDKNAAFTTCSITALQDAYLDYAFRYRGTQDPNWLMRLIGFDLSLFAYNGVYKTPALAYLAMQYLTVNTPIRLTTPIMDASSGITYIAGISEDNTNVSILISNYNAGDTSYHLELTNLPWDSTYTAAIYIIDNSHHLDIIEQNTLSTSTYTTTQTLKSSSVHFIRLTNTSIIPDEGPTTARIPFLLRLKILDPFTRVLGIFLLILLFS